MENQENSYIITILKEIKQDINETNQRIDSLEEKFDNRIDSLEEKFDKRIVSLEEKFDNKFDTLEKKVDNNSANIIRILNTTSKMQKDITELRDDIETVYSLEKDSRKQLKRLL